ncbi:MAG: right-handed parallel beta-helix repeat-containing protein [Myxococcota bacterium]
MPWRVLLAASAWALLRTADAWGSCEPPTPRVLPPCQDTDISWSATGKVVTIRGPVSCTLSDVAEVVSEEVLQPMSGNRWLLRAKLMLEDGARLVLHGAGVGGDVDELRLMSNSARPEGTVWIIAQWGEVDIDGARIRSWDEDLGGPDTEPGRRGRAYLAVKSFMEGGVARESRMSIRNSELSHLGYNAPEAYGLSWKVMGTGESGSTSPVFDQVEVYASVTDSHLHDSYMGAYTWGASCSEFARNEVAYHEVYGLDPHDNSDHLDIIDNQIHHNGLHGIICSKNCDNLTIRGNVSHDNGGHGIMLHRAITQSVVEGNEVYNNAGIGIAVHESNDNLIRNNLAHDNETGIRVYVGSANNVIQDNEVFNNSMVGIEFTPGLDRPTQGDGHPRNNLVQGNHVHHNRVSGLRSGDARRQIIRNNRVQSNGT